MSSKILSASIILCTSILTLPAMGQTCDSRIHNSIEQERRSLSALNHDAAKAKLYNFRSGQCQALNKATHSDIAINAFLPGDETSLGMYQQYRDQGDKRVDALKHTLRFMLGEQAG